MKQITEVKCHRVISEPGDMTHYDYLAVRNEWHYMFMAYTGNIKYPYMISNYEYGEEMTDEIIADIAENHKCNPWTVKECLRTIKELESE